MLTQLLDIFSLLSVLLRAGALAFQSLVLGGALFLFCVLKDAAGPAFEGCRRLIAWSAAALAVTELCYVAADSAVLAGASGLGLRELAGANFFLAGAGAVCAATAIAALTLRRSWRPSPVFLLLAAATSGALVITSHAAGRLEHRAALSLLTAVHHGATAAWIGGMPYLLVGIARSSDADAARLLSRRFSRIALTAVAALATSGAGMSLFYVGSVAAIYGTAYGVMVASKATLLGILLSLGALNFLILRRPRESATRLLPCLRTFAEVELWIGFTTILAAASLTSQPPAADLEAGRLTAAEIVERMRPRWPRLDTPELSALSPATPLGFDEAPGGESGLKSFVPGEVLAVNGPGDIAWSEYNHHWAGLIVLIAGLGAVLARSGFAPWARHWPLAFLGLAVFLFLRADPENWPLGPRSFWQSFAVAEVLQHRLFVLMIIAFAGFEWAVETGRISSLRASLVFPSICATGGALLLAHSHSLGNVKEELLAELSHIPLAIFAVAAGSARWLELRLPADRRRIPGWVWPVCFALIGVVLLNYRES